jgi:hypothetical protein
MTFAQICKLNAQSRTTMGPTTLVLREIHTALWGGYPKTTFSRPTLHAFAKDLPFDLDLVILILNQEGFKTEITPSGGLTVT